MSGKLDRLIGQQRRWLSARGLTDRPWFLLASAPEPTIPTELPENVAHIHIKYAGHSAAKQGLPDSDLTFLLQKTKPEQIAGLNIRTTLRMRRGGSWTMRMKRLVPFVPFQEFEIRHRERDLLIESIAGSLFAELGSDDRPSNGITMICYAIAVGIPQIIVAGMSLSSDGHAYNEQKRKRRHVPQDEAALSAIARRHGQVATSEPALAQRTGLTLYAPAHRDWVAAPPADEKDDKTP